MEKKAKCGCKDDYVNVSHSKNSTDDVKGFMKVYKQTTNVFMNIIMFIITVPITLLVVIPFSVYMIFRLIFFREGGIDFTASLTNLGRVLAKINGGEDVEEDEPFYDFDENAEYILVGVEDVETVSLN